MSIMAAEDGISELGLLHDGYVDPDPALVHVLAPPPAHVQERPTGSHGTYQDCYHFDSEVPIDWT